MLNEIPTRQVNKVLRPMIVQKDKEAIHSIKNGTLKIEKTCELNYIPDMKKLGN
jgi:hypothetical protein